MTKKRKNNGGEAPQQPKAKAPKTENAPRIEPRKQSKKEKKKAQTDGVTDSAPEIAPKLQSNAKAQVEAQEALTDHVLTSLLLDDAGHGMYARNVELAVQLCEPPAAGIEPIVYIPSALEEKSTENGFDEDNTAEAISRVRVHILQADTQVLASKLRDRMELNAVVEAIIEQVTSRQGGEFSYLGDTRDLRKRVKEITDPNDGGDTSATSAVSLENKVAHAMLCVQAMTNQAQIEQMAETARQKHLTALFGGKGQSLFVTYVMNNLSLEHVGAGTKFDATSAYEAAKEAWTSLSEDKKKQWKSRVKSLRAGDANGLSEYGLDDDVAACVKENRPKLHVNTNAPTTQSTTGQTNPISLNPNAHAASTSAQKSSNAYDGIKIKEEDDGEHVPSFRAALPDRSSNSPFPRDARPPPPRQPAALNGDFYRPHYEYPNQSHFLLDERGNGGRGGGQHPGRGDHGAHGNRGSNRGNRGGRGKDRGRAKLGGPLFDHR